MQKNTDDCQRDSDSASLNMDYSGIAVFSDVRIASSFSAQEDLGGDHGFALSLLANIDGADSLSEYLVDSAGAELLVFFSSRSAYLASSCAL